MERRVGAERFEHYFTGNGITEADKKRSTRSLWSGYIQVAKDPDRYELLQYFGLRRHLQAWQGIRTLFRNLINLLNLTFRFRKPGETIAAYIAALDNTDSTLTCLKCYGITWSVANHEVSVS